jgi:O-succinylbenzoate synthase
MSHVLSIELRMIGLPLVRPFRTSFGEETEKRCVLVRIETSGGRGWGECVAGPSPDYLDEFNEGCWLVIREHLAPALFAAGDVTAEGFGELVDKVRGHRMAKAALEMALLDAELRERAVSLASHLGAVTERVRCGVSVGIQPTTEGLLEQVDGYLAEGYQRIKLKIEPGLDVERVSAVREAHPDILLSVDANQAYTMDDVPTLRALDPFDLLMVEQPLSYVDLWEHAKLARLISSPICLDESIRCAADARSALEMGSCTIVNIKQGRVGGLMESVRIHDAARDLGAPVWCGGMLETGIGRAANLALAAMPNFTLPGDTSASSRYFHDDITQPHVMAPDGTMAVPQAPGLGVEPRAERLRQTTLRTEFLRP